MFIKKYFHQSEQADKHSLIPISICFQHHHSAQQFTNSHLELIPFIPPTRKFINFTAIQNLMQFFKKLRSNYNQCINDLKHNLIEFLHFHAHLRHCFLKFKLEVFHRLQFTIGLSTVHFLLFFLLFLICLSFSQFKFQLFHFLDFLCFSYFFYPFRKIYFIIFNY